MMSQPKWLFFCILLKSIHSNQASWEVPYFSKPVNSSMSVTSDNMQTTIGFDEEITPPFVIADINYYGNEMPNISNFDGDGSNSTLGIVAQKSDSNWQLIVTDKQDYESNFNYYTFTVKIGTISTSVIIAVNNIHDNVPTIIPDSKICRVNESFVGPSSCKFTIEDVDGNVQNLTVTVDAGNGNSGSFGMDTKQIVNNHKLIMELNIMEALDYETQDLYSITITAKCSLGSSPLESNVNIIVQVNDLPDEPPKWIILPSVVTINEKTEKVVQVKAIDGDLGINANISYSILNVTHDLTSYITIDNVGQIKIQGIDRDSTNVSSFTITVQAFETLDKSSNINGIITFMLEDLDDHSPDVQPTSLSVSIDERRPATLTSQITIKDPDLGESGSFNVELVSTTNIEWNKAFEVVPNYGYQFLIVTVATTNYSLLDYSKEDWRNITLQLIATEIANKTHIGTATLHINITPVKDRYPEFVDLPYVVDVLENSKKGFVVLRVEAVDKDYGDIVTYKMNSSVLEVNTSGVVTIAQDNSFDYEKQTTVQEVVQAVDSVGYVTYAQIIINIIDVDDTPPTLTLPSELLKVKENSDIGTVITNNITASDPDTNASLVFSLDWNGAGASKQGVYYDISHLNGCLEIQTEKESAGKWRGNLIVKNNILDYEKFDSLYITIVVEDVNTEENDARRSAIATIEIEDVNDNSPVFNAIPALSIEENSNTGKQIGTVSAKDADGPGFNNVTYSLVNAALTPADLVSIDKYSGELTVQKDKGIDCELIQTLHYTVTASDGDLSSNITIEIQVIDENDNSPDVKSPNSTSFEIIIPEESPSETHIFTIKATDADYSDPYHNITYLINYQYYPQLQDYFYIEPYTGELIVKLQGVKTLNRDTGIGRYNVYLILRDNYQTNSPINSNSIDWMLTVVLSDINDNAPVFPDISGFLFSVKEDAKNGSLLLEHLQATDLDAGDNAKLTYLIVNVTAGSDVRNKTQTDLFMITTVSDTYAQIYAKCDLEGYFGTYTIYLEADDHGNQSLHGMKSYQVYIEDINDHAPKFVYPTNDDSIYIQDIQTVGAEILDRYSKVLPLMFATDQDSGENAQIKYFLLGPDVALKYFSISNTNDSISLTCMRSLDKDDIISIPVMLKAEDQGTPSLSTIVNFTLLVIIPEEYEPMFTQTMFTTQFTETSIGLNEEVIIPEAVDKNNVNKKPAEYQMVYYYILDHETDEIFQLNSTSRKLRLLQELDREQKDSYVFNVAATNNATGPPESPGMGSYITIKINVKDVNDCPPQFLQSLYAGGIKTSDEIDKVILTVQATDPDINDSISYSQETSISVSDSSLSSYTSNGISITESGQIILNFKPQTDMKGYFYFNVTATDLASHNDSVRVFVYLISASDMVKFTFLNPLDFIDTKINQIENIFSSVFGYKGTVDSVTKAEDDNHHPISNRTDVLVHFIDTAKELPVDAQAILQQTANVGTIKKLRESFSVEASLDLEDLQAQTNTQVEQTEGNQSWVGFIIIVAILVVLFIALVGLYIWKTRSLQERLDKMAATSNMETHKETNKNITLSTANLYENKTNPVLGLSSPTYNNNSDDISAYIDEALHGLEEKIDLSSTPPANPS